jgi:hypothetical protein
VEIGIPVHQNTDPCSVLFHGLIEVTLSSTPESITTVLRQLAFTFSLKVASQARGAVLSLISRNARKVRKSEAHKDTVFIWKNIVSVHGQHSIALDSLRGR